MDTETATRNRQRVENTFRVIDLMEDIRDLWRQNAPTQNLDDSAKETLLKKIKEVRKALDNIEASL